MASFDLMDEGWLPLRRRCGRVDEVGIAEALLDAGEFTDLVVEIPTQIPALLRQVLLPVMVDALGVPSDAAEWGRRFTAGGFDRTEAAELRRYLDEHRPRFDLFSSTAPFAQVAGLEAVSGETKGAGLMVPMEASGNNVPFFACRTEGDTLALTPAQAARWLLHAQCWDTAAIKTGAKGDGEHVRHGKTMGNPTGPLGQLGPLIPMGRNLHETLRLNVPLERGVPTGTPQWRGEPAGPGWTTRDPVGLLDLWTWQSRRIRLISESTADGDQVPRIVLSAGDRMRAIPEWEPHTAWVWKAPARKGAPDERRPRRHATGTAIWRGLGALLATERTSSSTNGTVETSTLLVQLKSLEEGQVLPGGYPLRLGAYAIFYGTQSAVVEDIYHDEIPLPLAGLRADADTYAPLVWMAQQAEQLAQAVNHLSSDLRRATGLEPFPWDKAQRPGERALHILDPVARRVLSGLQRATDKEVVAKGLLAWEQAAYRAARATADPLFAAVPESVFAGRRVRGGTSNGYSLGMAEHDFHARLTKIFPVASARWRHPTKIGTASPTGPGDFAGRLRHRGVTGMAQRYWNRYVGPDGKWRPARQGRDSQKPSGADLATMRAGLGRDAGTIPALCRYYTCEVDDWAARRGEVSIEQAAEHAALALFGLHQQGKDQPMHRPGVPLGKALRHLRGSGRFSFRAVDARVTAAATATTVPVLLIRLRGLIGQLRGIDQPLDYDQLMQLILDWHYSDGRHRARRKWAVDYKIWIQDPGQPGNDASNGPAA